MKFLKEIQTPFHLKNRNILVDGMDTPLERECCRHIVRMNGNLLFNGPGKDTLRGITKEDNKKSIEYFHESLETEDSLKSLVQKMPILEGCVFTRNNALHKPFKYSHKSFMDSVMDQNFGISMNLLQKLLSAEKIADNASIVFVSSVAGLTGSSGEAAYAASQGAILAGSRALAQELARYKIRVNVIAAGLIITPLSRQMEDQLTDNQAIDEEINYPLGYGSPEDVANSCVFLLSQASRWITGITLNVDGGFSSR